MAGQMAKRCEEVTEKRGMAPVEVADMADRSHLPVPSGSGAFHRQLRRKGLKVQALPAPLLLVSEENHRDHFNEINRS
jgi:hypothetical protein